MKVYHYTTGERLNSILSSNQMYPSSSSFIASDDSTFGPGWYFTDLPPRTSILTILRNLWKIVTNPWGYTFKAKSYLEFEIDSRFLEYCRPNVYRLKPEYLKTVSLDIGISYTENGTQNVVIKYLNHGETSTFSSNFFSTLMLIIGGLILLSKMK